MQYTNEARKSALIRQQTTINRAKGIEVQVKW